MTCRHCGDAGLIRICYHEGGEPDFALCLCDAGHAWRVETNIGRAVNPLWQTWAARHQVEHDRIGPIEEWHDEAELRRMFPGYLGSGSSAVASDDLLLAAGRTRKGKL